MTLIYALRDPDTGRIRWVGQTYNPGRKRLLSHVGEARKSTSRHPKNEWIRSLLDQGKMPLLVPLEEVSHAMGSAREHHWMLRMITRKEPLLNLKSPPMTCVPKDAARVTVAMLITSPPRRRRKVKPEEKARRKVLASRMVGLDLDAWLDVPSAKMKSVLLSMGMVTK